MVEYNVLLAATHKAQRSIAKNANSQRIWKFAIIKYVSCKCMSTVLSLSATKKEADIKIIAVNSRRLYGLCFNFRVKRS
jgi:hypothetical protein